MSLTAKIPPTLRHRIPGLGLLTLLSLLTVGLRAQDVFTEPVRVTDGSGVASQSRLALSPGRVYIVSTVESRIAVRLFSSTSTFDTTLPHAGLGQGDPAVQSTLSGGVLIAYSQEGASPGVEGREVFLVTSFGQTFSETRNLSRDPADDYGPAISKDPFGEAVVFWTRSRPGEHRIIQYDPVSRTATEVASGQYPSVLVSPSGVTHLIYTRDRDLYYKSDADLPLEQATEVRVTSSPAISEYDVSIGEGASGEILVAYESAGSLFVSLRNVGGSFGNAFELVSGGARDPQMLQEGSGNLFLTYARNGDIFYIDLNNLVAPQPVQVTDTPDQFETAPDLRLDLHGDLHLTYYLEGDVYYVTNSSRPEIAFSADPRTGEQPLEVSFNDETTGQVEAWLWDFGDGTTSDERDPVHVYDTPGAYTVSLTVIGPGGSAELVQEDYILVQDPSNTMWIPDLDVFPQQKEVWVPVMGTFADPLGAISIAGTYDPGLISIREITLANTYTSTVSPELFITNINEEGDPGRFTVAMLVDFPDVEDGGGGAGEFQGRVLPPGDRRRLVNLVCDLSERTSFVDSVQIELGNSIGPTRISCTYTVGTRSEFPVLTSGHIRFVEIFDPPPMFVRSDVDGNGARDISDAISLLDYLFIGNFILKCPDAADHDDSGLVDLSDAIAILSFQFLGGRAPMVPFPSRGADPTEDSLPDCEL